jgi:hypothetical protein
MNGRSQADRYSRSQMKALTPGLRQASYLRQVQPAGPGRSQADRHSRQTTRTGYTASQTPELRQASYLRQVQPACVGRSNAD